MRAARLGYDQQFCNTEKRLKYMDDVTTFGFCLVAFLTEDDAMQQTSQQLSFCVAENMLLEIKQWLGHACDYI